MHDERDSAGYALARLLKVTTNKLSERHDENKAQMEREQAALDVAHAQTGLERMNLEQSRGGLNLLTSDFEPNAYAMKQGNLAGVSLAGQLRDRYMAEGIHEKTDPAEFSAWLQASIAKDIEAARQKGPQYYQGFITALGSNVEMISKEYAGHATSVIENASQTAVKQRLKIARGADAALKANGALANWMKGFLHNESAGNFNAWYGNAGNKEDLGRLTLRDVYERQQRPGDDAAGILQLTPGTLKSLIKQEGYSWDMKFTPALQMELTLTLMKRRGLREWLGGELPDHKFIDRLASEWAAFQNSRGGMNLGHGGTKPPEVTLRQLYELREHLNANPHLKSWVLDPGPQAGKGAQIISTTGTTSNVNSVINDEAKSGVSQKVARDKMTEVLVEQIEAGELDDYQNLEDELSSMKMSSPQRDAVLQAVEARQKTREYQKEQEVRQQAKAIDVAIRSGNLEELDKINPKIKQNFVDAMNELRDVDPEMLAETSREYRESVEYSDEDLGPNTVRAFLGGEIDKRTYTAIMDQHQAVMAAMPVLEIPAIDRVISVLEAQVPAAVRHSYRSLLAMHIKDLRDKYEGNRPPISEVLTTAKALQASLIEEAVADAQTRMGRPEYNLDGS